MPADHRRPLDGYYDPKKGKQQLYALDESQQLTYEDFDSEGGPMVRTASVQRDEHMLIPWMERMEPLILVGPEVSTRMLSSKQHDNKRTAETLPSAITPLTPCFLFAVCHRAAART